MTLGVWNKIDVGGTHDARVVKGKEGESSYFSSTPWSNYLPSLALYNTFTSQTDPYISTSIRSSLSTLSSAYRLYGPDNVVGSYNGGKDACVIMHLQRAAHAKWWEGRIKEAIEKGEEPPVPTKPRFVYFENPSEFPSILTLLHTTVSSYDLSMCELSNCSFKDGLSAVIENTKERGQMGFVLGTRKGDPNCEGQESFSPSSDWMPPFMRINPILNWSYGSIWHFLRIFQLEYCELYDEGYTSLGKVGNTRKCESLRKGGVEGEEYWPAYMLVDWTKERQGREGIEKEKEKSGEEGKGSKVGDGAPCSVGLLIIGDEILKGLTHDTNTHKAAVAFSKAGVPMEKVVVVGDDEMEIAENWVKLSQEVDYIITSGGVGPTHDDVTMKAISRAENAPLKMNVEMRDFIMLRKGVNVEEGAEPDESTVKMATLPSNSKLLYLSGEDEWPVLSCGRTFVLPGVPEFFEKKVELVAELLKFRKEVSKQYKVVLNAEEESIVTHLNSVVSRHPFVQIGSYPYVNNPSHRTIVTLEAKNKNERKGGGRGRMGSIVGEERDLDIQNRNINEALRDLLDGLEEGSVIRVE